MPLEIKELHIRVSVNQTGQGEAQGAQNPGQGEKDHKDSIIQAAVEQVMELITGKNER